MEYILLFAALIVLIALLFGLKWYKDQQKQKSSKTKTLIPVKCPVCNSDLYKGENLVSKVFRPMKVSDQLMTISGCPHCYPKCEPGVKRLCPVCHKVVKPDETLTARLFNKSDGKKHVHIVGCINCHKPRAD